MTNPSSVIPTAKEGVGIVDPVSLLRAKEFPQLPFGIRRVGGQILVIQRTLRILPGRRITAEAMTGGRKVLAKIFLGTDSARYSKREFSGLTYLHEADLPTPRLIGVEPLAESGHLVLTEFLCNARSLLSIWSELSARSPQDPEAVATIVPIFSLLGRLHLAGLTHEDVHLGNFIQRNGTIFVVDGDAVRRHASKPVTSHEAHRNLAMLIAQLPIGWDQTLTPLLDSYQSGNPGASLAIPTLKKAIVHARTDRMSDYMRKTRRNCSRFKIEKSTTRFTAVIRTHADRLAMILSDPDRAMASGILLKNGRSSTVARVELDGLTLVIKRYNIKNWLHALSRAPRPSRAWRAWTEGHRLRFLGVPTPLPVAIIERRIGPLRGRAWLISEFCDGISLRQHFDQAGACLPTPDETNAIKQLFAILHHARITHGDLKAQNLLWTRDTITLIDLDSMTFHRCKYSHSRAWVRDRRRFVRNWPRESMLNRWLDRELPPP